MTKNILLQNIATIGNIQPGIKSRMTETDQGIHMGHIVSHGSSG